MKVGMLFSPSFFTPPVARTKGMRIRSHPSCLNQIPIRDCRHVRSSPELRRSGDPVLSIGCELQGGDDEPHPSRLALNVDGRGRTKTSATVRYSRRSLDLLQT